MKLTRREVLVAAVAVAALPKHGEDDSYPKSLRKVERQTPSGWEQVRMVDLKKGDIFRLHDLQYPDIHLKPYRAASDGQWCDRNGAGTMQAMLDKRNAVVQAEPV